MNTAFNHAPTGADPVRAILDARGPSVLAVIAGVEGPSYRPLGAMMAVMADGSRVGTLSSGCIEADIALHAGDVLATGAPRMIRYGQGSPFVDIELPCGGGLDILLVPNPDKEALGQIALRQAAREDCSLTINIDSGAITLQKPAETGRIGQKLSVRFDPAIRFLVFGKGPEASTFAALVQSAGYPNLLLSPDSETLQAGVGAGCPTRHMTQHGFPKGLQTDDRTAIVLFFHDHDWEPPILKEAVQTNAFYIGSQGSQRARDKRHTTLAQMGVSPADIARLRGPVGLIPSARDAGTLAVSVLSEILAVAMQRPKT
ncbi:XdhC family protein [Yoonia sp. GPGPB17]|uniref:XdhC family protein n=1 Tax=Yoonia sp. GPGPB17 TaxID=3026147 RepID=UPI0030C0FC9E